VRPRSHRPISYAGELRRAITRAPSNDRLAETN
jgi:hypothetical protein